MIALEVAKTMKKIELKGITYQNWSKEHFSYR